MQSRNFRLQKVGNLNWLEKNYKFQSIAFSLDELIVLNASKTEKKINEFVAISYFQGIRYTINNLLNSEDYNSERLRKILKLPKLV